jgi:hypothetical protein
MSGRLRLWLERGEAGFHLRDAATDEPVRWSDPRVRVVHVAGVSFREGVLPDSSFDPGRRLALVPETSRPACAATSRPSRCGGSTAGYAC